MGLFSRMETVFKSKINKVLNRMEDLREKLDYSYERQLELLQRGKSTLNQIPSVPTTNPCRQFLEILYH